MESNTLHTENRKKGLGARLGGFLKRHRKLLVFLLVVAIGAAVALYYLGSKPPLPVAAAAPQTTRLQTMDLQQIVSATGTLQSQESRQVSSTLSYDIQEIYVEVGDSVQAGQALALVDSSAIDDNIAQAKKSIADAVASDALSLAQAERKLEDARNNHRINWDKNDAAVQAALAALDSTPADFAVAAGTALAGTPEEADKDAKWAAWQATITPEAPEGDAGAKAEYDAAHSVYDQKWLVEYAAAEAARSAAQGEYDRAVSTRDTADRSDRISIENMQDSINSLKIKDSTSSLRTQLEGYEDEKEKTLITAPTSGIITAITAEVGQSAGGSMSAGSTGSSTAGAGLFTIENAQKLEIPTSVPEYDMVSLHTGLAATITSDALDGETWQGVVSNISPKATDTSGNFTVMVTLTSPVGELAIGMSAKINIITAEKAAVFAVPYDAVTTNASGQAVVYAWTGGDSATAMPSIPNAEGMPEGFPLPDGASMAEGYVPGEMAQATGGTASNSAPAATRVEIPVETGMETDYYIEISGSGLREGMLILTDPNGTNAGTPEDDAGMGFGPGMGAMP